MAFIKMEKMRNLKSVHTSVLLVIMGIVVILVLKIEKTLLIVTVLMDISKKKEFNSAKNV